MANELRHESTAAGTSCAQTDWEDIDIHRFDSQATGDIAYASSATQLSRLAKGTDGDILKQAAGIPSWATPAVKSVVCAYPTETLDNLTNDTWLKVMFDAEDIDTLGEFDSRRLDGAADATEASKLHDADGGFEAGDVGAGIYNVTDDTWAEVTGFVDSGELDISADIMANGETYILYRSWFTAASNKYVSVSATVMYTGVVANDEYYIAVYRDGSLVRGSKPHSALIANLSIADNSRIYLTTGQILEVYTRHKAGANTPDIYSDGNPAYTRFELHEIPAVP